MNNIIPYLVQSAVILMVLYSVYRLFLQRDTFFYVNRFYLLLTLLLSLIMPLFDIRLFSNRTVSAMIVLLDPVMITPEKLEKARSDHHSLFEITGVIYLTGIIIFTIRLLIRFIQLALIIRRNKITRQEGMNIVFVDRGYSPFSFFNLVFIRKEYYVDGKLTPVLAHEKVHIRQYHTLDLLLAEVVTIIQWFNPFAWLMERSIKSNHEFLADEGVLKEGFFKKYYQTLILNEAMGLQVNNLTNNFNVSLIKNRIQMMTKSRSGAWAVSKVLITLPAIFFLALLFSAGTPGNAIAQEKKKEESKNLSMSKEITVEQMPSYPGGHGAMIDFMIKNIKYPELARKNNIQGTVLVSFAVETDGSLTGIKVMKGIGSGCDEESVRVVKLMPKWIPGMDKGKPVRVQSTLPIKFALGEKSDADKDKAKDQGKDQK